MTTTMLGYFTQPPDTPATQQFDAEPDDEQLASWVAADNDVIAVRVRDTPGELAVKPAPIPLWFVVASLAVPILAMIGWAVYQYMQHGLDGLETGVVVVGLPMGLLAAATVIGLIHVLNRKAERTPASFVLDRSRQKLSLPRFELTLPHRRIVCVVQVRGPYRRDETRDTRLNHRELSVVARDEQGAFVRYPLKLPGSNRKAIKAGRAIAEELGVPLRELEV
ncbi:MAG: hypothetical protein WD009_04670 [Phycisphaeraceae bacterium]